MFRRAVVADARAARWAAPGRVVTLDSLRKCPATAEDVVRHAKRRRDRREAYVVEKNLDEVAFEMLGDMPKASAASGSKASAASGCNLSNHKWHSSRSEARGSAHSEGGQSSEGTWCPA